MTCLNPLTYGQEKPRELSDAVHAMRSRDTQVLLEHEHIIVSRIPLRFNNMHTAPIANAAQGGEHGAVFYTVRQRACRHWHLLQT